MTFIARTFIALALPIYFGAASAELPELQGSEERFYLDATKTVLHNASEFIIASAPPTESDILSEIRLGVINTNNIFPAQQRDDSRILVSLNTIKILDLISQLHILIILDEISITCSAAYLSYISARISNNNDLANSDEPLLGPANYIYVSDNDKCEHIIDQSVFQNKMFTDIYASMVEANLVFLLLLEYGLRVNNSNDNHIYLNIPTRYSPSTIAWAIKAGVRAEYNFELLIMPFIQFLSITEGRQNTSTAISGAIDLLRQDGEFQSFLQHKNLVELSKSTVLYFEKIADQFTE